MFWFFQPTAVFVTEKRKNFFQSMLMIFLPEMRNDPSATLEYGIEKNPN